MTDDVRSDGGKFGAGTGAYSPAESTKLRPKEHGAYAILAIPIATALLIAGFTVVGVCVAVAAVAGFLAHEPLLVAWGHRGRRALSSAPSVNRRLAALLTLTLLGGTSAVALGSAEVRLALGLCLAMALVGFALAAGGMHRTMGGQLWGVGSLSVACIPILLAGGMESRFALEVWIAWWLGFTATTIGVRGVIAAQKRQPRLFHLSVLTAVSTAVVLPVGFQEYSLLVTLPMIAMSWYLLCFPPPAKYLRRVGWTLVGGTLASALLVLWSF